MITLKAFALEIICACFMLLFIYAALSKWFIFDAFVDQMKAQPFPDLLTMPLVYGLPTAELLIAAMLLFSKTRKWALYAATGLMAIFTVYLALLVSNFYKDLPCSCGGVLSTLTWPQHIVFNLFFVTLGLVGIYLQRNLKKLRSQEAAGSLKAVYR